MAINFTPTAWKDGQEGGTPITAAQLNRVETALQKTIDILSQSENLPLQASDNGIKAYLHVFGPVVKLDLMFETKRDIESWKDTPVLPAGTIPEQYRPSLQIVAPGDTTRGVTGINMYVNEDGGAIVVNRSAQTVSSDQCGFYAVWGVTV